jgi:RNA polymerase primary sigma factor
MKKFYANNYVRNYNTIPPLSKEEESFLIKQAQNGDKTALKKIISSNMRFVIKVASCYSPKNLTHWDLIQEGYLGLHVAVFNFDITRGLKFVSYATWWIKSYITNAIIEKEDTVRQPANRHYYYQKNRFDENDQKCKQFEEIKNLISFETIITENGKPLSDVFEDVRIKNVFEDNLSYESVKKSLLKLKKLYPRYHDVLINLYGLEEAAESLSLEELAQKLKISKERVRQIKTEALKKVKTWVKDETF